MKKPTHSSSLVWTNEIPTEEGFYFSRLVGDDKNQYPQIKVVIQRSPGEWRVCESRPTEFGHDLSLFTTKAFQWAGPIPWPEEPQ